MSAPTRFSAAQLAMAHGVLLLDKPVGLTSNAAVQAVRRQFGRAKAGHTGTLDPLASGLLPICLGEATKFSQTLLEAHKCYTATLRLGWRSSTGDAEGELQRVAPADFGEHELQAALQALSGDIEQLPPMHSAIKVDGQPLYKHARKGLSVARTPRRVQIFKLEVTGRSADRMDIFVHCSKGTYIRVLAEDLGARLGCGAYLTALRRVAIGSIGVEQAVALEDVESASPQQRLALLKPVDLFLEALPKVVLGVHDSTRLGHGLSIPAAATPAQPAVRIYSDAGRFLGLGEVGEDGALRPRRLVSSAG